MTEERSIQSSSTGSGEKKGIGFGVFLLVAGLVLLAQQLGIIPKSVDWFFPLVLVIWGASELYRRLR